MSKKAEKEYLNPFVQKFVELTKPDSTAEAEKTYRQAKAAVKAHISSYEGDLIDLEDSLQEAKESYSNSILNHGHPIIKRGQYISNIISEKNKVSTLETQVEELNELIELLKGLLEDELK